MSLVTVGSAKFCAFKADLPKEKRAVTVGGVDIGIIGHTAVLLEPLLLNMFGVAFDRYRASAA
jgi:hypothetical protein